jgi:hypothetical protein
VAAPDFSEYSNLSSIHLDLIELLGGDLTASSVIELNTLSGGPPHLVDIFEMIENILLQVAPTSSLLQEVALTFLCDQSTFKLFRWAALDRFLTHVPLANSTLFRISLTWGNSYDGGVTVDEEFVRKNCFPILSSRGALLVQDESKRVFSRVAGHQSPLVSERFLPSRVKDLHGQT